MIVNFLNDKLSILSSLDTNFLFIDELTGEAGETQDLACRRREAIGPKEKRRGGASPA